MKDKPRVIVCQHGARHRYAIPRMLEKAGMLEALYTDSCEYSFLGKIAKAMGPLLKGSLPRLANRKVIGVPKEKVYSSDTPCIKRVLTSKTKITISDQWLHQMNSLRCKCFHWGLQKADILYGMECENIDFSKYAKENEFKIVVDVVLSPLFHRILLNEMRKFPKCNSKWHRRSDDYIEMRERYFLKHISMSNIILCPSEFVADGVRELCPEYADKIRVCPYGSSIDYGGRVNKPVKGRFLWAGGDWLRKGLHYLAEAADRLKMKYPDMEFRVAGITDPAVIQMERFRNITFLGKLNREQMQDEFLTADAFVFPTLSEGMVGTGIEAIAAGCPIITTKAAGIDAVVDGKSGLIIPPRDSNAVAETIERLYVDRELRDSISREAVRLADNYTEEAWGKRIVKILVEETK